MTLLTAVLCDSGYSRSRRGGWGANADAPFGMLPRTVPGMGDGSPVSRSCSFKCLFTQNIMTDKINQFTAEIFVPQKILHQSHFIFPVPQWSGLWHFPPLGDKEWGAWWGESKATECLWSGHQHHTSDNTHNDDEFAIERRSWTKLESLDFGNNDSLFSSGFPALSVGPFSFSGVSQVSVWSLYNLCSIYKDLSQVLVWSLIIYVASTRIFSQVI